MDINSVIITGKLGADPELRYTQGGTPVLNLRVACDQSYKTEKGKVEKTLWVAVVLFGPRGEALSKFLEKGGSVTIRGCLEIEEWEQDGAKRSRPKINASFGELVYHGKRARDGEQRGENAPRGGYGQPRQPKTAPGQPNAEGHYANGYPASWDAATAPSEATTPFDDFPENY